MSMNSQVLMGSGFLTICALLHVGLVAVSMPAMNWTANRTRHWSTVTKDAAILTVAILFILFAHTVQIWIWALVYETVGAFGDLETSFYFATVTYTTLGYGDLVLGEALRIFATFGAITGLLTFGISTAFLIAVLQRLLPKDPNGHGGF